MSDLKVPDDVRATLDPLLFGALSRVSFLSAGLRSASMQEAPTAEEFEGASDLAEDVATRIQQAIDLIWPASAKGR